MDFGLDGRTALVTGAAGRIGSEDCHVLAAEGAEIVALDVDEEGVASLTDELSSEYDAEAHPVECDLTDRGAVADAVAAIEETTGGVDVLINNAGLVDATGRVENYDDDLWDRDVSVNLTGTYNVTREVYPRMKERGWGRIVTMSSVAGQMGGFGQLSYSSTKSALIGFGKSVALEGADHGITSNILTPSIVVDDLAGLSAEELEEINPYYARMVDATPMGTLGREADVANMIAYLCSEQAGFVTGQVIGITGGIDLLSY